MQCVRRAVVVLRHFGRPKRQTEIVILPNYAFSCPSLFDTVTALVQNVIFFILGLCPHHKAMNKKNVGMSTLEQFTTNYLAAS